MRQLAERQILAWPPCSLHRVLRSDGDFTNGALQPCCTFEIPEQRVRAEREFAANAGVNCSGLEEELHFHACQLYDVVVIQ
jgi:hypothetical protein